MATGNTSTYTGGMLITNYDFAKIFVWDNRYKSATYTNGTGSEVTLAAGTIMGRVAATNKVLPWSAAATDGSQFPRFVLANDYTVANGASETVTFCFYGGVATNTLTIPTTSPVQTLTNIVYLNDGTTVVGTAEDCLNAAGIFLVGGTENTFYDNQP
jgi:hypothetical protein